MRNQIVEREAKKEELNVEMIVGKKNGTSTERLAGNEMMIVERCEEKRRMKTMDGSLKQKESQGKSEDIEEEEEVATDDKNLNLEVDQGSIPLLFFFFQSYD